MSWASVSCQLLNGSYSNFSLPEEEEFEQLKSKTSISDVSLDFFNDEYVQASINKKWLWIFSAELWEFVNHDRRVEVFSSADYLPNMLKWWATHDLNQCNVFWDGKFETTTYKDPIGAYKHTHSRVKGDLLKVVIVCS